MVTVYPRQGDKLIELLRRLEAATSRLEDIALSADHGSANVATPQALPQNGSTASTNSTARDAAAIQSRPEVELPPSVGAMDELIESDVKDFEELAKGLDPLVIEQVGSLQALVGNNLTFADTSSSSCIHSATRLPPRLDKSQEARHGLFNFWRAYTGSSTSYGRGGRYQRFESW